MGNSSVLSTSGYIYKQELVRSVKIRSVTDHLILESSDPFPDVHHKHKPLLPHYFYIAIDPCYLDSDIVQLANVTEHSLHEELDAAVGDIELEDQKFNVLRLKKIPPKQLSKVIDAYREQGIRLHSFGRNINEAAVIHIRKFFYLEKIEKGFYLDLDEPEKGYVEIPRKFKWQEFQHIVKKVKNDCPHKNFDAAFGTISKYGVTQDIVRIYCPVLDKGTLLTIGKSFLKHLFL